VIVTHNSRASRVSDKTAFFNIAGAASLESSSSNDTTTMFSKRQCRPPRTTSPASSDSTA